MQPLAVISGQPRDIARDRQAALFFCGSGVPAATQMDAGTRRRGDAESQLSVVRCKSQRTSISEKGGKGEKSGQVDGAQSAKRRARKTEDGGRKTGQRADDLTN